MNPALLFVLGVMVSGLGGQLGAGVDRPNILWITAEDHGPHLGCYGVKEAMTPHLDAFAREAVRFTRAHSNAPVCAPARTTIITGMLASSNGAHHMRSRTRPAEWLRFYPQLLRAAGYYCTNNSKEDYNIEHPGQVWDESSGQAHWKNRPEGKPFFAIFNTTVTHESQIRSESNPITVDPAEVELPGFLPDLPEARRDWARYLSRLTVADAFFAEKVAELTAAGLVDDTIVFYYADHGPGIPRGKRYVGDFGLRVPLLVRVPAKWRHLAGPEYREGGTSDRLVAFIDLAPTVLNLAGAAVPEWMEGTPFLGAKVPAGRKYNFGFAGRFDERPGESRSVVDGRWVYIRNFQTHLAFGRRFSYQHVTPTTAAWYRLFKEGKLDPVEAAFWLPNPPELLFDLETDPWETRNLAGDPGHREKLLELREALTAHLRKTRDTALWPETLMAAREEEAGRARADLARSEAEYPLGRLLELAGRQLDGQWNSAAVREGMADPHAAARTLACQMVAGQAPTVFLELEKDLLARLGDEERAVRAAAAQAIAWHHGYAGAAAMEQAREVLWAGSDYRTGSLFLAMDSLNGLGYLPRDKRLKPGQVWPEVPEKAAGIPGWGGAYLPRLLDYLREEP